MKRMQSFNPRIGAWVMFNEYADGHCLITDVKQREPNVPFKGVPRKR